MTEKYYMQWSEVFERIDRFSRLSTCSRVYGVPRGGAIVAGLLEARYPETWEVATTPGSADVVVDDIIDSGATLKRHRQYGIPMRALVDKLGESNDAKLGWVVFPWEERDDGADIADTVVRQLEYVGEDPKREGLVDTPRRYIKALKEFTTGYADDPKKHLERTFDAEGYDQVVIVSPIEFVSMCEHHILPFIGSVHFAYLPSERIVGLSKIARAVRAVSRRLQVQERMTQQLANAFNDAVKPRGVAVVVKGEHSCMALRGIESRSTMTTSIMHGFFRDDAPARAEVLALMGFK